MNASNGHHLILGELSDFLTGIRLEDTHDERYRQKLAKLLVEEKGYPPSDIIPRKELTVRAENYQGLIRIDLSVIVDNRIAMIIKYGPGSLTTRHRPTLGMSRLLKPYQIPVVVVTNGEDADVLDGRSGKPIGSGFEAIPGPKRLADIIADANFEPLSSKRIDMETRIVYCYEIDGACPCDTTVCRLPVE